MGHSERGVEQVAAARIPTRFGDFQAIAYRALADGEDHVAYALGDLTSPEPVLARVHSECLTGDLLGSIRCDCGSQLDAALERIGAEGRGVIVYLRGHEGRGIGIAAKLRAYALQDQGRDTVEANVELGLPVDSRQYDVAAAVLRDLGVTSVRLMSNNPAKFDSLSDFGISIAERVPLVTTPNAENLHYLETKQRRMGHLLDGEPQESVS